MGQQRKLQVPGSVCVGEVRCRIGGGGRVSWAGGLGACDGSHRCAALLVDLVVGACQGCPQGLSGLICSASRLSGRVATFRCHLRRAGHRVRSRADCPFAGSHAASPWGLCQRQRPMDLYTWHEPACPIFVSGRRERVRNHPSTAREGGSSTGSFATMPDSTPATPINSQTYPDSWFTDWETNHIGAWEVPSPALPLTEQA